VRRLVLLALVVPLLVACGDDKDGYCDAVKDNQKALSEQIGSNDPDALLEALDIFRELQDRAPSDIADEWQAVVGGVGGLREALEAAGADPETYDPASPPPDVTPEEQKEIKAASRRLTSRETLQALQAVDQQVRDVCHTPLFL
jgi:hypothetical protein